MLAETVSQSLHHDPHQRLKIKSEKWTLLEWEGHLQSLESSLKESLISQNQYKVLSETRSISGHFNNYTNTPKHRYSKNIKRARRSLTKREDKIIDLYFYQDIAIKDIAKRLRISRFSAYTYKRRALAKIKKSLISQSDFFIK